jgi:ribosomal protein L29
MGTDITEVAMNDDVKVVEDFTDVSDDELAALVAELKRELGNT